MHFWPLFNLSFSNVQLISDKKKKFLYCPILSLLWVNKSAHGSFSLASGSYVNLDLFETYGKQPEMACFSELVFPCPCFILGSLNIPEKFSPWFSNIKKKNSKVEAFLSRKILQEDD